MSIFNIVLALVMVVSVNMLIITLSERRRQRLGKQPDHPPMVSTSLLAIAGWSFPLLVCLAFVLRIFKLAN